MFMFLIGKVIFLIISFVPIFVCYVSARGRKEGRNENHSFPSRSHAKIHFPSREMTLCMRRSGFPEGSLLLVGISRRVGKSLHIAIGISRPPGNPESQSLLYTITSGDGGE